LGEGLEACYKYHENVISRKSGIRLS